MGWAAEHIARLKDGETVDFLIGNNRGGTNGWITGNAIFGRCTSISD
jgi:hypothetical protein